MGKFVTVAASGLDAIRLHPLRSLVTSGAVIVILVPYLAGLAVSSGIQQEAEESVQFGADLYVSALEFGRTAAVPLPVAERVREIDGVTDVVPRIVGHVVLGKDRENVVLVGLPANKIPPATACVDGRLFQNGTSNEFVVGSELAHRLHLKSGSLIPPFYKNPQGDRVSKVVGIFKSDVSIWQARLMFTSFETAAHVFDNSGFATDLLVYCRPGYEVAVRKEILRSISDLPKPDSGTIHLRVIGRQDLEIRFARALLHHEGIFNLHFLLVFVVGIAVTAVTSGIGLSERRREIGTLKATGWQTDEVLLRSLVESLVLSTTASLVSLLGVFVWLRWLNGFWIAGLFLSGAGVVPHFEVPYRLMPIPVLLLFLISLVIVMTGTLYSTWRAATVPPSEAMR